MLGIVVTAAFCTAVVFLIFKIKEIQNYFQRNNIPCVEPIFLVGSVPSSTLMRSSISEAYNAVYKTLSPHRIGGFYETVQPVFMVRDPDYVQQTLINNYSNFYDRGFQVDEKLNPLDGNVFFLNGSKWRFLRSKLSPIFTSKKVQSWFGEMKKCTDQMIDHLDSMEIDGTEMDLKNVLLRYTVNIVATTAFGMELERFEDEKNERMCQIAKKMFAPSLKNSLFILLRFVNPKLLSTFGIKTIDKDIDDYFMKIVGDVFERRLSSGYFRNDLIHLLLQLREKGEAVIEEGSNESEGKLKMDDKLLTAQAFLFFVAGSETTTNTLHSLLYMFSIHEDIQETVRQEVISSIRAHGTLNYEALQDMTYLDLCVKETLRLFPPSPVHLRACTKDFTFPDGTTVKTGNRVIIPAFSIQRDSKHFEDPLKFKPERFNHPPLPGTYLPFGDGPKLCLGKKFADTEIKLAASQILEKFRLKPSAQSVQDLNEIRFEPKDFFLTPIGGYVVRVEKIRWN